MNSPPSSGIAKPANTPSLPSSVGLGPALGTAYDLHLPDIPNASADGTVDVIFGDEPSYRAFTRVRGLVKSTDQVIVTITKTSTAITVLGADFVASAEELRSNVNAPPEGLSMSPPMSHVEMLCGALSAPKIPYGFRLKVDHERRHVTATQGRKQFGFRYGRVTDAKLRVPALTDTRQVDTDALRQAIAAVDLARPRRPSPQFDRIFFDDGIAWAGNKEKASVHEDHRLAGIEFGLPVQLSGGLRTALGHLPSTSAYGVAGEWSVIGAAGTYFAWPAVSGKIAPHLLEPLRTPSVVTIRVGAKDFLDTLWAFSALDRSPEPIARLALKSDDGQLVLQAYIHEVARYSSRSLLVTTIDHGAEIVAGSLDVGADLTASVDYIALRDFAGSDYDEAKSLELEWITRMDHAQVRLRRVSRDCTTILTLAGNWTTATASINTKRRRR